MRPLTVALAVALAACNSSTTTSQPDLTAPAAADLASAPDLAIAPDLALPPDLTAPTCSDGVANGDESDVDCGGASCPRCIPGKHCRGVGDCDSGVCTGGVCAAASCSDGVKNGGETDVDCGGACQRCATGAACLTAGDCASSVCSGQRCAAASCSDGVRNGAESDVDCGAACPSRCDNGKACGGAGDCASGVCTGGICVAATCSDNAKNGAETDVDCGGGQCAGCVPGKACAVASDCNGGACTGGVCQAPTCSDGIKNGAETDVDCGGTACMARCTVGQGCAQTADCTPGACSGGKCQAAACSDGIKNGDESDVDCGGSCPSRCGAGKVCLSSNDCGSKVCTSGKCVAPSCSDGIKNGKETDVDCGGGSASGCPGCLVNKGCGTASDCAAGLLCGGNNNLCQALSSCADILRVGAGNTDGVYWLDPCASGVATQYYCDMTTRGGGWTVAGWQPANAKTNLGIADRGTFSDDNWSRNLKCIPYTDIMVFNRTYSESFAETYPQSTWNATTTNLAIGAVPKAFKQGSYGPATSLIMMGCVDYSYSGTDVWVQYGCDSDAVKTAKGHIADYAGEYCSGGRLDSQGKYWAWTDAVTCKYIGVMYTWGIAIR